MPDLHPDLPAYTNPPAREEGTAVTPEQLLARLLTDDPARSLDRLLLLLTAADRGNRCLELDHAGELDATFRALTGVESSYSQLLATLVMVAATHPTTAAEALAEHTATTPPPPPPVGVGHVLAEGHDRATCHFCAGRRAAADSLLCDDHDPATCRYCADTLAALNPDPVGLADPDTECDCPDRFRSTVGPNDHHASCAFTKHVLSTPNDPRSPDLTRHRHPTTGETVYTIPTLPKDTP